ncbi:MAG TPA: DEAD/DEAH box helicase family protein [Solirubrobacteraceae bacterium]|nr:DEAD/DEAH box helicase family protein [Solirubrobacteraceae bacterium]
MAAVVTSVPTPGDISRAEKFTREAFVHAGETTEDALGPGSARRHALDAALIELDAGAKVPSPEWRRRYSLMLGLERVLSDDEPKLADGTSLNPHQVDALSGTLTALLAEAQRNGGAPPLSAAPVLAVDDEPEDYDDEPQAFSEDDELDGDDDDDDDEPVDMTPLDIEIDIGDDDEDDDESEEEPEEDVPEMALDEDQLDEAPDDPNAHKRFWFEHATGAGKTVAAMGFVDASRTGGVLILTHRRNLVDQFHGELKDRGYAKRITPALLRGKDSANGPVTVETYQWFVRNAGKISEAYSIVICDEAHTALGEKTSASIRAWTGPIFIGMTATGALIARHVTDLFPTQTSRFDLAQAARRGVISPLRCVRIPPGVGVKTIAKVPLRRGEVDVEFDQEMLAELLDQGPFNFAAADLYKTRFNGVPGVIYAAGVKHAYNLAEAFREQGVKAMAVSGETRKRDLAEILARYERGDIDVLVNAQLLAEGWNSPRATVCMHLAPTASKRIYQQRVGRVTRRNPGKEAGIVVDFVAPETKNDDAVVTLHSLLDRDVYRGGAIVVGPVRRGRGRRLRVERRVLPVTSDEDRRIEVFERELWRIAVEHLPYGEQIQWAALAGARVAPSGWRRARAMLHFDREGAIKRAFLLTAVQRNNNPQLRVRALQEIAASRDGEAFDSAIDEIGTWTREERREGTKVMLLALAEKRIGRRDQANAWIWRLASYTRDVHEEYAVQRWPETKRLLGLLVNSSGAAHARNARRLVHAARKQDRRLSAALLAAAVAHSPEGEEILRGARTRLARKPSALSRELLRNFPKSRGRRGSRRRRKKGAGELGEGTLMSQVAGGGVGGAGRGATTDDGPGQADGQQQRSSSRRSRSRNGRAARAAAAAAAGGADGAATPEQVSPVEPQDNGRGGREDGSATPEGDSRRSRSRRAPATPAEQAQAVEAIAGAAAALAAARGPKEHVSAEEDAAPGARTRSRSRRSRARAGAEAVESAATEDAVAAAASPAEAAPPAEGASSAEAAPSAEVAEAAPDTQRASSAEPARAAEAAPVVGPVPSAEAARAAEAASSTEAARTAEAAPVVGPVPSAGSAPAAEPASKPRRTTSRRAAAKPAAKRPAQDDVAATPAAEDNTPAATRTRSRRAVAKPADGGAAQAELEPKPAARRRPTATAAAATEDASAGAKPVRRTKAAAAETPADARPKRSAKGAAAADVPGADARSRRRTKAAATADTPADAKPARRTKAAATADTPADAKPARRTKAAATAEPPADAKPARRTKAAATADTAADAKPARRTKAAADAPTARAKPTRRTKAAATDALAASKPVRRSKAGAGDAIATKPKRRTPVKRAAATPDAGDASPDGGDVAA